VDIAMGLACSSTHGFDQQSATIECKINYIRAVADGEVLCTARVIHPGRHAGGRGRRDAGRQTGRKSARHVRCPVAVVHRFELISAQR
jgi:acyl-coenzyme A thioesterase PaaI-like protein